MSLKFVLALTCVICTGLVSGFRSGAPRTACGSLRPFHGVSEQKSPSPYVLNVSSTTVRAPQAITVTLFSPYGQEFAGYIVQAQAGGYPVGSFSGDGKIVACSGTQATITHSDRGTKTSVSFFWLPPTDFTGQVVFKATVVKSFTRFWTGIESIPVNVV